MTRNRTLTATLALALLAAAPLRAATGECLDYPYTGTDRLPQLQADMKAVHDALEPFGSLVETLAESRPVICLSTGPSEALGTYETEDRTITVGAALPSDKRVAVLLHEIRHLDQDYRGYCPSDDLAMRSSARATFALEADAMAITHLIAWSYAQRGTPGPFDALTAGKETADIAAAFITEMDRTDDPALATAEAFSAWYASDARREKYYVSTCMAYLERAESEGYPAGQDKLPAEFIDRVCRLPGGGTYPCEEPVRPIPR